LLAAQGRLVRRCLGSAGGRVVLVQEGRDLVGIEVAFLGGFRLRRLLGLDVLLLVLRRRLTRGWLCLGGLRRGRLGPGGWDRYVVGQWYFLGSCLFRGRGLGRCLGLRLRRHFGL